MRTGDTLTAVYRSADIDDLIPSAWSASPSYHPCHAISRGRWVGGGTFYRASQLSCSASCDVSPLLVRLGVTGQWHEVCQQESCLFL